MAAASPKARSYFSTALARAWRCLLILSVWQGPLPYWHCHDGNANGEASCEWFVRHLQCFHPDVADCATCALGWHVHFGYPQPTDDSEPPSPNSAERFLPTPTEIGNGLTPPPFKDMRFWRVANDLNDCAAAIARRPCVRARAATHFFDGFASALPWPLRFGVARC